MGANVTVITHGNSKVEDAKKLGADHVVVTGDKPDEAVMPHRRTLDLIISTSSTVVVPWAPLLVLTFRRQETSCFGLPASSPPSLALGGSLDDRNLSFNPGYPNHSHQVNSLLR